VKQGSIKNIREESKNQLTPKSIFDNDKRISFGSGTESVNIKDLKRQIEENIQNLGADADEETQYKIFLCIFFFINWKYFFWANLDHQRKKQLQTLANQIESNIEDHLFAEEDCQHQIRTFLDQRAKFHKENEKKVIINIKKGDF
jgi:hypothetical protein